jgi:hypothetical protein
MPIGGHLNPGAAVPLSQIGWTETHAPAAATQAIASRAAGAAGIRHICTAIGITVVGNTVAPAAQVLTFNLRDGATGVGTVLQTWRIGVEAVAGKTVVITLSGLAIPGSAATAMTLEGSAAPGANTFEAVTLVGYDSR